VCLYCHSSIRLGWAAPSPSAPARTVREAVVERSIAPDVALDLRQLVLSGKLSDAEQRYVSATGAGQPEARQAVASMASQILRQSLSAATLNAWGIMMILGGLILAAGFAAVGILETSSLLSLKSSGSPSVFTDMLILWCVCAVVIWFGLRPLLMFRTNILPTLRFLRGRHAQATVLNSVVIGQEGREFNVRLWLEVQPAGEAPFRIDLTVLSVPDHLSHTHPGAIYQVKYLPDDHSTVVLEKALKY
jgi:hypothetical protein